MYHASHRHFTTTATTVAIIKNYCVKNSEKVSQNYSKNSYPATTGLPLSLLAWGSVPRGPLAILKDTMTGKAELPLNLGKSAGEYFQELKKNLKLAQDVAGSHAEEAQQSCISRCNLRASEKSFEIGLRTYCPIVCVLKGKDGGRIAVNYRYLNKYCEEGAYPMPEIADLLCKVDPARFNTLCGIKNAHQLVDVMFGH